MARILVVDDDEDLRELLEVTLRLHTGWAVITAPDGARALAAAAAAPPDLIVLDVWLPGLHGVEVYRLLRARPSTREVPIIFLTATPERLVGASLEGPYTVLAKPCALETLLKRITALLATAPPPAQRSGCTPPRGTIMP